MSLLETGPKPLSKQPFIPEYRQVVSPKTLEIASRLNALRANNIKAHRELSQKVLGKLPSEGLNAFIRAGLNK